MKKPPKVRIISAAKADKAALATWLAEWTSDGLLAEDPENREGEPLASSATSEAASESPVEPIECGQIRLLQPSSPVTRARPRYVAVLETFADGTSLIAPFSRFSVPATPGELATGETALPVRVLCAWNARRVPASTISASWNVGVVNAGVREDAAAIQRHLADGTPPSAPLAARTGPPLRHPLDPRMEYLDEERAWMDDVAGASRAGGKPPLRYERQEPPDLLKAAEEKGSYSAGSEAEPSAGPPDKEPDHAPGENPPGAD